MPVGDHEKALDEFHRVGPATDRQKVDQLDEYLGLAAACFAHRVGHALQAGNEAVIADAKQRAARHVADSGGFDHDRARAAGCKARVPLDVVLGDKALVGGAPGHHRRNPGALGKRDRADLHRAEQARFRGDVGAGPGAGFGKPFDTLGRTPHGDRTGKEDE